MQKWTRRAAGLVCAAMILAVAGCRSATPAPTKEGTSATSGGQVTIDVWHFWDGHEAEAFKAVVAEFEKSNTNIKVNVLQGADEPKILTAISGGTPPDVAFLGAADPVPKWAQDGAIQPLDDLMKTASFDVKSIAPAALKLGQWKGKQYAVPFMADAWALYYNKDLFKEAGLDPNKPPTTIEELNDAAKKLTKRDAQANLSQAGFIPSYWQTGRYPIYIWAFGGEILKDGKFQLTNPDTVAGLKWSADMHQQLGIDAVARFKSGFGKYASPEAGFYTNKVAMAVDGEWQIKFIEEFTQNKLNYGVVPFPVVTAKKDQLKNMTWFNVNAVTLPKGAKHPKEAWAFIQFLESTKAMDMMSEAIFNIPTLSTSASTNKLAQNPNFKLFIDLLNGPNARATEPNPVAGQLGDELNALVESSDAGTGDLAKSLGELQTKLQAEYDKATK